MKRLPLLFVALGVSMLSGCANMNSIYRSLNLGTDVSGVAVDAKQRAIFSTPPKQATAGEISKGHVVCAEPSPDALSAYLMSLGASGTFSGGPASGTSPDVKAQLAGVAAETAGSIGLRTQSIQLLRDGLFSNCLAYMNGAVDAENFYLLQRRSQNFTLGLLAIEQLTGPVRADSLALNTSGTAATGSDNTDKEEDALDSANTSLNEAQTALDTKRLELDGLQKQVNAQAATVKADDATLTKLKSTPNPDDAAKTKIAEAEETIKKDRATLESSRSDLAKKQIEVDDAKRSVEQGKSRVERAEENLSQAKMRVRASGSANAAHTRAGGTAAVITDRVADAVVKIVSKVLEESGRGEACNGLLDSLDNTPTASTTSTSASALTEAVGRVCDTSTVVTKAREYQKKNEKEKANLLFRSIK